MGRLQFAWIQLRSQLPEVASALAVIALGVGLATSILLSNAALEAAFADSLDALAGNTDLHVTPIAGGTIDGDLLDLVRSVPGVKTAAPLLLSSGFILGDRPTRVRIVGVDLLDDSTVRLYNATPGESANMGDPLLFLSQSDSAILPASLLTRLSARVGSRLRILTPVGPREITVRGKLDNSGIAKAFAGEFLVMDLYAAQQLVGSAGRVSQIDILIEPTSSAQSVQAALSRRLPAFLTTASVDRVRMKIEHTITGFRTVIVAISMMGLVLAAIITANRLSTIYQERMWEMAVLRGMGWTPRALILDLLSEATLVSTIATLIGLPLGALFAEVMLAPIRDATALGLQEALASPALEFRLLPLAIAAAAGLLSGTVAALLPALRAATAPIAVLSARRRRRDPRPEASWKRVLRFVLPLSGLLLFSTHLVTGSRAAAVGAVALLILGSAVLVQPALRMVADLIGAIAGGAAAVGVRDQSRAPSRAIGATAVLLAGIALVVWIQSTAQSFERYAVDTNSKMRDADLIIDSAFDDQPTAGLQPRFDEGIVSDIGALPGVVAVGADAEAVVLQPSIGLMAVDATRLLDPRLGPWSTLKTVSRAALDSVASGRAALADSTLLRTMGLQIGDSIEIMTPSGLLSLEIAGLTPTAFISAQGDLIIARSLYENYWTDTTVNRMYVAVDEDIGLDAVRASILERYGQRYGLRVRGTEEFSSWIADNVQHGFAFLEVLTILTIFVVVVGTADALAANVAERTREIGTLRALGYRPAAIAKMILAQAVAIGVAGCGLAVLLGLTLSVAFVEGVLEPAVGWNLTPAPSYTTAAWASCLGIASCILGGLPPAWRASRIPIVKALRYE